ncbi:MAG: ATP cone domain-containing protein [Patescibacteria group bacterium]|nr:ATP cone domain-containing protein [Patescibacteria group bacterium]
MEIVKSDKRRVEYNPDKIRKTLRRAGAKPDLIERVLKNVEAKLKDGMTTKHLYAIVRHELRRASRVIARRYNLRDSLLKLGPAGFKFEKYVASILTAYQYEAETPEDELSGLCVRHEIDVIARKNGRSVMIEAKFRNRLGDTVTLKDTMATWSAYLDLVDGAKSGKCPHFDELWIVTNGRFSERALQFGACRGIRMVGWGGDEHSLPRLVDHATLYPITVVDDLRQWELDGFASKGLMLCREIADEDPRKLAKQVGLPSERAGKIISSCQAVVAGK